MEEQKSGCCGKRLIGLVVILLVIAGGCFAWGKIQQKRALTRAEAQLKKGFGTLAAETLDRYRHHLVKSADHCKELVTAYSAARRVDRLEWASEACIDNGIETLETYEGLASAADQLGRDGDAIQVLNAAAQKFPKSPDPWVNMAKIFQKNKDTARAGAALMKGIEVAGNDHQLELQGLEFFAGLNQWTEAKQLADRLKTVQTDNPEVKLLVASALNKGGDKAGAKAEVDQAETLLAKATPEQKAALKKKYPDAYK